MEIWGTGNPRREVMHVDDLSSAIYFIINKKFRKNKRLLNYLKKNYKKVPISALAKKFDKKPIEITAAIRKNGINRET